ncbi:MAG: hypothetical protein M1831_005462 [Alyxoria varia]|nr:MAG: hypothetical protein M1831_005462 [Alyxoria varia]
MACSSSFDTVPVHFISSDLSFLTPRSSSVVRCSTEAASESSGSSASSSEARDKSTSSGAKVSRSTGVKPATKTQAKPKRTRARGPKVRTGCGTCKIRHKKCGEERPYCSNCVTKGYKCEGYDEPKKPTAAANKVVKGRVTPTDTTEIYPPLARANAMVKPGTRLTSTLEFAGTPLWFFGASLEERSCFEFFQKHTAPQLSRGTQSDFWSYHVLRLSNEFNCVKHAIITLGALHKETAFHITKKRDSDKLSFGATDGVDDDRGVACLLAGRHSLMVVEHSSKALNSLRELVTSNGSNYTELILSVCLLFVCIDVIRGQYAAAFIHLRSGMKLLTETGQSQMHEIYNPTSASEIPGLDSQDSIAPSFPMSSPNAMIPLETMIPIFTRLDTQASDLFTARGNEPIAYDVRPPRPSSVPTFFDSYEEASHCMLSHQSYYLYKMRLVSQTYSTPFLTFAPPLVMEELLDLRDWYLKRQEQWHVAFRALTEKHIRERRDDHLRKAPLSLLAYHHFIHTHLLRFPDQSGLWCDKNQERMVRILSASEAALNSPDANSVDASRSHFNANANNGISLCFDVGLAEPLFYVATKCRDPALRRKALRLLHRKIPSYDGIWNKPFATHIAARVIEIEESMSYRQDPGENRLKRRVEKAADIPRTWRIRDISPMLDSDTGMLKVWFYKGTGTEEGDGWHEDEFWAEDLGRMIAMDELQEGLS